MSRSRLIRELVLPALLPAALIGIYFTPVSTFGCENRGYMALAIVFLGLAAAVAMAWKGVQGGGRGEESTQWVVTTLILVSPMVLLFGPLR
jgi:hypothetical protein